MRTATGSWQGPYSFTSRMENGQGTNPEELLAAAHAGCFSMALAAALAKAGHRPQRIATTAKVHLEKAGDGFQIPRVELETRANVPGIDPDRFQAEADSAKRNCPVSKLFAGAEITLQAVLENAEVAAAGGPPRSG
jgi:osmotically inducible protein OsmC